MYRRDRKNRGGGLVGSFDSNLPSKGLKMAKAYKTLEIITIEVRINTEQGHPANGDIQTTKAIW